MNTRAALILTALAALGLAAAGPAAAQTNITVSPTAPTPGAQDISQLSNAGNSGNPDGLNYYTDNSTQHNGPNPGQTFMTGGNLGGYNLNSVSVQVGDVGNGGGNGAPLSLYLDSISGTTATQISSTPFTSPGFANGDWATFTLPSAQVLSPNSTYAFTIGDSYGGLYSTFANSNTNPYSGGQLAEINSGGGAVTYGSSGLYDATFDLGLTNAVARQSLGLNFGAEQSSLLPTDVAGAFPQANWNNLSGSNGTGVPLTDSTGTTITGAAVSYSSPNDFHAANDTSTPNRKLLNGYLDNHPGNTDTVTVSGIQYAKYDVYAYVGSGAGGRSGSVTIGGTTYDYNATGDPGGSFTQTTDTAGKYPNADYALFTGLTGSSFTLNQNIAGPNPYNSGLFGLQVVEETPASAAPEPSQLAGLGFAAFGALGLILKVRKRKAGALTA